MVRLIPHKRSASKSGPMKGEVKPFEMPKPNEPKVPEAKMTTNTGSDQIDYPNHSASLHSHRSHISDRYPIQHPHSHPPSVNCSRNHQHSKQSTRLYKNTLINNNSSKSTRNKQINGVATPFVGYQGRVTYTKPSQQLIGQQLTNHEGKILNTQFSLESNINSFRKTVNETLNSQSTTELIADNQSEKSSKKSISHDNKSP